MYHDPADLVADWWSRVLGEKARSPTPAPSPQTAQQEVIESESRPDLGFLLAGDLANLGLSQEIGLSRREPSAQGRGQRTSQDFVGV